MEEKKKKRQYIRLGDVFCVEKDNKFKQYFQFVAVDTSQLSSKVVRLFKSLYLNDTDIDIESIVNDDVELYAHTFIKGGIIQGLWYKVGNSKNVGDTANITFRLHSDLIPYIRISHKWYIWKINQEFVNIGDLPVSFRNYPMGMVYSPRSFYTRIITGHYPGITSDVI